MEARFCETFLIIFFEGVGSMQSNVFRYLSTVVCSVYAEQVPTF